jgi:hypothetical protein
MTNSKQWIVDGDKISTSQQADSSPEDEGSMALRTLARGVINQKTNIKSLAFVPLYLLHI